MAVSSGSPKLCSSRFTVRRSPSIGISVSDPGALRTIAEGALDHLARQLDPAEDDTRR